MISDDCVPSAEEDLHHSGGSSRNHCCSRQLADVTEGGGMWQHRSLVGRSGSGSGRFVGTPAWRMGSVEHCTRLRHSYRVPLLAVHASRGEPAMDLWIVDRAGGPVGGGAEHVEQDDQVQGAEARSRVGLQCCGQRLEQGQADAGSQRPRGPDGG